MNRQERLTKKLLDEQRPDGSFGRFHTMDSKLKQKIPTTQAAAWLMHENSFTRDNDMCNKMCHYMERLINDLSQWPDAWEKNKWFKPAVPLFIASTLALFGSEDEGYIGVCDLWIELLIVAFEAGSYSPDKTNAQSNRSLGVEIDGSYLGLHSLNHLALYACNTRKIPAAVQRSYLKWLHHFDGTIAYTNTRLDTFPASGADTRVLTLLSKFEGFGEEFPEAILFGAQENCLDSLSQP